MPIVGYEGLYEVSDLGRVRSLDHLEITKGRSGTMKRWRKGRILAPRVRSGGYIAVTLPVLRKDAPIHHLVCEAFNGKRPHGYQTNHKDGDKKNNIPSNLEWVTAGQNRRHAMETGLHKTNKGQHWQRLDKGKVSEIRRLHKDGVSGVKISRVFGISEATVMRVVKNVTFKNYG